MNAYKYIQGGCQEDGARFLSVVPSDRTRSNGHKPKQKKLHPSMRINFSLRVAEPWNRLPWEFMEFSSLKTFKTLLYRFPSQIF